MIESLKDLERLLKLCRKQGVTEIKLGAVELKLGEMPVSQAEMQAAAADPKDPLANFPEGDLTPEQLAFYSAGGHPDDDPFREQVGDIQ